MARAQLEGQRDLLDSLASCRMMGFECPAPHTVTRLRHCNSLLEEPLPNQGQEASPSPQRAGIMPYGGVPFDLLILRQPCCVVQAGLELLVLPSWLPEYQDYRHEPRPPARSALSTVTEGQLWPVTHGGGARSSEGHEALESPLGAPQGSWEERD